MKPSNSVVVLDANAYVETNYGRSGKFSSLVDFLRKSSFRILLLATVLEEVLAKYERVYQEKIATLNDAVKDAANHCFTGQPPRLMLGRSDASKEEAALRNSLFQPARGVVVEYFDDLSACDVLEIVRRGARRVAPANASGEELRDVIHWLTILAYAKSHDVRTLFVTRDNGFWLRDGGLREQIARDIEASGKPIEVYRDVEDLLKRNALSATRLDPERARSLFDLARLGPSIVEEVGSVLRLVEWPDSRVDFISGEVASSEFQTGTIYTVSADSEFVEAIFRSTVDTQIAFVPKLSNWGSLTGTFELSALAGSPTTTRLFQTKVLAHCSMRVTEGQPGTPELERVEWP